MNKKDIAKKEIVAEHGCNGICSKCVKAHKLIDLMSEANIPAGYWNLTMNNFEGPERLKDIILSYSKQIDKNYRKGKSICLSGNQGTGKTMSSICILRVALKNNYSAYYTTASDILNDMTNSKFLHNTRAKLRNSDFLVIDELDSRFFVSDSAKELFSGIYENIFRYRSHNLMPTIICTNETAGILDVFRGPAKQSIDSLNNQYLIVCPFAGKDFRKIQTQ